MHLVQTRGHRCRRRRRTNPRAVAAEPLTWTSRRHVQTLRAHGPVFGGQGVCQSGSQMGPAFWFIQTYPSVLLGNLPVGSYTVLSVFKEIAEMGPGALLADSSHPEPETGREQVPLSERCPDYLRSSPGRPCWDRTSSSAGGRGHLSFPSQTPIP